MKVIWAFAGVFIIALAGLRFCTSLKGSFSAEKYNITEIIVRFPGEHGDIKSPVIKTITSRHEILPLVEFANRHAKYSFQWVRVDSALSSVASIHLRFMAGTES